MSAYVQQVLADSPVLYWPLDEGTGTTANDRSGNARNGTLNGTPAWSTLGPFGRALVFDASNDWISSAYTTSHAAAVTVEAWCNPDTQVDSAPTIIGRGSYFATAIDDFPIFMRANAAGFGLLTDSGSDFSTDTTLGPSAFTVGRWYHVVGAFANGTTRLYVNGVEVANAATAYNLAAAAGRAWGVGRASFENGGGVGDDYYKGYMAQVAIYGAQLTAARIAAHYEAGLRAGVSY